MALGAVPKPPGREGRWPGARCDLGLGLSQVRPRPTQDLHPPLPLGTDSLCDRSLCPRRAKFLDSNIRAHRKIGMDDSTLIGGCLPVVASAVARLPFLSPASLEGLWS